MELKVNLAERSYFIILENNKLDLIDKYVDLNRKVIIISDSLIPYEYIKCVKDKCLEGYEFIFPSGEKSKNFNTYYEILKFMLNNNFSRKDLVIALGGGVSGDLGAFVASTYKRGIEFVNIPTSSLAMIDSSVGGKNGIDFEGVKNVIGTFYQPSLVFIDISLLKSLDKRNLNAGLVEALKAGLIYDPSLYELFLNKKYQTLEEIEEIIIRALKVKIDVVEKDEKELGLRKILNFGHTIGHGYEASLPFGELIHGEAVGLGMLKVLDGDLKNEVKGILEDLNVLKDLRFDKQLVKSLIVNDKKSVQGDVDLIMLEKVGEAKIVRTPLSRVNELIDKED